MQNRISNKTNLVIKEAGVDADLTLKTEMQRISSVVKNATIRGYKVYKLKWQHYQMANIEHLLTSFQLV